MRLIKKPFILDLLIFIVATLMLFSIAGIYQTYKTYSHPEHQQNTPLFLEKMSVLLYDIGEERVDSTAYISQHKKRDFTTMQRSRVKVDQGFQTLLKVSEGDPSFTWYVGRFKHAYSALQQTRRIIDDLGKDAMGILFHRYHSTVSKPIIDIFDLLSLSQKDETTKAYLTAYSETMQLWENALLEYTGIYHLLLQKRPMHREEKDLWERLVETDDIPDFQYIPDEAFAVDLRSFMDSDEYRNLLKEARMSIGRGAVDGAYGITTVQWIGKMEKKLAYIQKASEMIFSRIVQVHKRRESGLNTVLILYSIVSVILLFVLWALVRLRIETGKKHRLSEDTQRDIELVFDKEQQKKLKRLIENGNVNQIYKFLIQAIKDANRTKDLFLAGMSHEIRTPLNGILGFTQLLKETELNAEQQEFLSVVEKSSDHLLRIVNDILDLSKIKAEKIELEMITFDPLEVFEAAVESYSGKAHKEQIEYEIFIDPALPVALVADPTKISQVIVNLVSNAIKFTPEHGTVSVEIRKISENDGMCQVYFAVSDTGIGISKEQRERIFEAFGQADVSTSRKYGGTGLGLSISGRLVERMGGKLGIRSIVGEGSTFHFTLDLKKDKTVDKRRLDMKYEEKIGILDPHLDLEYFPNTNLEKYIAYTGAEVKHFTDRSFLQARENGTLPKLVFIDHKYRMREGELVQFLDIDSRIVVLSTGDQKKELARYDSKIERVLYKPVTFSKTLKAIFAVEQEEATQKEIRFKDMHILVAEDNMINQRLIRNVLERMGIAVTLANNGQEAVNMRKETDRYDMILMDIEMPVMGGMEATAQILAYERADNRPHIPIIALTANALAGDKAKYTGAGMDGYLAKPIDLALLRALLEDFFPLKAV